MFKPLRFSFKAGIAFAVIIASISVMLSVFSRKADFGKNRFGSFNYLSIRPANSYGEYDLFTDLTPVSGDTEAPSRQFTPLKPAYMSEANMRAAIISAARRYIGATYLYDSRSPIPPMRFDCSGFIVQAYEDALNVLIPRSSYEMWTKGKRVSRAELKPGDIIVYSENGSIPSHVSMYVDSASMIHSVSDGYPTGVVSQRQDSGSWSSKIIGYVTFVGVLFAVF